MNPRIARAVALAALWLTACVTHAIEVPKAPPPPEQKQEAAPTELNVTPTDERAFYEKVQRVTAYRSLRGLKLPTGVIADLGGGNAEGAVAALSSAASQGSNDANIALVHVQHWCSRHRPAASGRSKGTDREAGQGSTGTARRARRRSDLCRAGLHEARGCQLQQSSLRLHRPSKRAYAQLLVPAIRRARRSSRNSCATPPSAKRCCRARRSRTIRPPTTRSLRTC